MILAGIILYCLITAIIFYAFIYVEVLSYRKGEQRWSSDNFELLNWEDGVKPIHDQGPTGCVGDVLLWPFHAFRKCTAVLRFAYINFGYYLIGGKEKRINYIKEYLLREHAKLAELKRAYALRLEEAKQVSNEEERKYWEDRIEDAKDDIMITQFIKWKGKDWDLEVIINNKLYSEFSKDILMSPSRFWIWTTISFLGLLVWPVTIFVLSWFRVAGVFLFGLIVGLPWTIYKSFRNKK